MADLVENVLRKAAEKESKYKTIEVEKDIDVDIDVGLLLASDPNPIDLKKIRAHREKFLQDLARDNTQLLINRIWQLPTEKVEDAITVKLPDPKLLLPREKRIPKGKPLTKWGKKQEWKPKWGYKRANDETQDWMIEVPDNADPNEDQFEKKKKARKERGAKNELQRLRNIARSQKSKVPGVGLTPTDHPSKDHVTKALTAARKSTASIGKFTANLKDEKTAKHGKKRKFESNYGDMKSETKKQLNILDRITSKKPRVDVSQAVNQHIAKEEKSRSKFNKSFSKKKDSRNRKPPEKNFKKGKNNKVKFQGKNNKMKFQGKKKRS
ncbi:hypothetical protein ScPMuIL_004847 [Solemya velum]